MPNGRNIIDALRVAASWLLVVSVFFGPVGLGGSSSFASPNSGCGAVCPCEDAGHDVQAAEHAELDPCDDEATDPERGDDGEPCEDQCPDDCPNCSCCHGISLAVLPLPVTSSNVTRWTSARVPAPIDAPLSGAGSSVFRPPRSLT